MKKFQTRFFNIVGVIIFVISIIFIVLPFLFRTSYDKNASQKINLPQKILGATEAPKPIEVAHVDTPKAVKGIYMTACVAGTPSWREKLKKMIDDTEINAIIIDIKDSTGTISFPNDLEESPGPGCKVKDLKEFIEELHKDNIYVLGRISVFQDPLYTKLHPELAVKSLSTGGVWKDRKGLSFIDVGAKPYWEFIIKLAKESYALGFDEINFDYMRYPSDGNIKDMKFDWRVGTSTKSEMVTRFFSYLHNSLKDEKMKTSVDLFGLVTVADDDLGIGQVLTNALPYFDYIDPMVYPSHFAPGTDGFSNPAEHPYEIIHYSMGKGRAREDQWKVKNGIATSTPSKLRPWLQDFDLGANYGVSEVQEQIKATYNSGMNSWLVWDAGNKYTPEAYLKN